MLLSRLQTTPLGIRAWLIVMTSLGIVLPETGHATLSVPSINEIEKYLIVGFKDSAHGDAVNLQNGEFGADREVLSTGDHDSPTGASFPNIRSVFDQRWKPDGSEAYLVHPIGGTKIAPDEGIDWSGNIALTDGNGELSVSDTDIFADLGNYDPALAEIGIVTASANPVQSISNADYFKQGDGPSSSTGLLPSVGIQTSVDLAPLTDQINDWKIWLDDAGHGGELGQNQLTQDIENQNYKEGGSDPFVIELLSLGGTARTGTDLSFVDVNGDGFVFIDVSRPGDDWKINNTDLFIDGPSDLTAIFVLGEDTKNMDTSNSSIQIGEGGIADDGFGAIFYKGALGQSGDGDAMFAGSNVVLNGIALWELNEGTNGAGENEIDIQNGQGCAQFIGSTVLHTSNSRFNKCTYAGSPPTGISEPGTLSLFLGALLALGWRQRRQRRRAD